MNHSAIFDPEGLKNRRVTVMGLGRFGGGIAAVRYLVSQNALVTVTDQLPERELAESLQQIADLPLQNLFCGNHPDEAFDGCELLVVNPAVKPDHPVLASCQAAGIAVVTEIQLLLLHLQSLTVQLQHNSSQTDMSQPTGIGVSVVAVSGSNGKSTTAALIHHLLTSEFRNSDVERPADSRDRQVAGRKCWLGGNIGGSLLKDVENIQPDDVVVLELSSFQLHYMQGFDFAPEVALLTEFSPNHLDWHPDLQHYQAAKQNLFRRQTRQQTAVLPASHITNGQRLFSAEHDDEGQPTWRIRCNELRFGIMDDGQEGVFWDENSLVVRIKGVEDAVRMSLPTSLSGQHNLNNLTAAACAAIQVGADPMKFPASVLKFRGLPFRLALSGQRNFVQFINDSASTTPESTIAAVKTMRQRLNRQGFSNSNAPQPAEHASRLVVIVGGANKGSDLMELAEQLCQHADAAVLIGDVAFPLKTLVENVSDSRCEVVVAADDFPTAFRQAVELVAATGIVLLSPGCSSFGWFRDYVDRGQQFDLLVKQWIQR